MFLSDSVPSGPSGLQLIAEGASHPSAAGSGQPPGVGGGQSASYGGRILASSLVFQNILLVAGVYPIAR